MKVTADISGRSLNFDLGRPIDISLPLSTDARSASAWYVPPVKITAVRTENFVGDVNEGGSVNFNDITFNPHGNGTHTESVGHISMKKESVNAILKKFFFTSRLISIKPEVKGEDKVITLDQVKKELTGKCEALVIRTLPNSSDKKQMQYSNSNPPFIEADAIPYILSMGVDHLLIDLPSIDREFDKGALAAHHAFWNYPADTQLHRTITEFIFVPDEVKDGFYLLNIQIAPFENDASPSKPVLYAPIS